MSLIVPASSSALASFRGNVPDSPDVVTLAKASTPIPEGLPEPALYRMHVMPVQARTETKGGIMLPDETIDVQKWVHALGRVVGLGPLAFTSPTLLEMGLKPEMCPKIGDYILFSPRGPWRFTYRGVTILSMNDDQFYARVDPDRLDGYSFHGIET